jgi:hypothetical protein
VSDRFAQFASRLATPQRRPLEMEKSMARQLHGV